MLRNLSIAWLTLAASLTWGAPDATARETVHQLDRCPAGGWPVCLSAHLYWDDDGSGRVITAESAGYDWILGGSVTQDILIKGRLADGEARLFRLRSKRVTDEFTPTRDIGAAAFLGRSPDNRPIIMTDRGPLEFLTPSIDVSYGNVLMIADDRTWRFTTRYLDVAGYTVTSPEDIGVWNDAVRVCIAAPTREPGLLKLRQGGCAARNAKAALGNVEVELITLRDMRKLVPYVHLVDTDDEDTLADGFGGDGCFYSVFRVPKTHTLIFTSICDPC